MEDLEDQKGVLRRNHQGKDKSLVPDRMLGAGIIGFGGLTAFWVDPENGVGFEITVTPVNILEMLCGDDGNIEIV